MHPRLQAESGQNSAKHTLVFVVHAGASYQVDEVAACSGPVSTKNCAPKFADILEQCIGGNKAVLRISARAKLYPCRAKVF